MTTFIFNFSDSFAVEGVRRARRCSKIARYANIVKLVFGTALLGSTVALLLNHLYAPAGLPAIFLVLVVGGNGLDEAALRRRFRQSWQRNLQITIELVDEEVRTTSDKVEVQVLWTIYTKARRFPDGFLLFQENNAYNWLPLSSIVAGTADDAQQIIQRNIADYQAV